MLCILHEQKSNHMSFLIKHIKLKEKYKFFSNGLSCSQPIYFSSFFSCSIKPLALFHTEIVQFPEKEHALLLFIPLHMIFHFASSDISNLSIDRKLISPQCFKSNTVFSRKPLMPSVDKSFIPWLYPCLG